MPLKTITNKEGNEFKMGRKRPVGRGLTLSLKNYLIKGLPAPPVSCDYRTHAYWSLSEMYGNNVLGDCLIAAMAHGIGVFTGAAGDQFIFTEDQIIALYSAIGGYVPGDPTTDNGCSWPVGLSYWTTAGAPAGQHQITGHMLVDSSNPTEYRQAIYLFENLLFGLELPDEWISPVPSKSNFTWDLAGAPDPNNGHAVVAAAYNKNGPIIDTWGMVGTMTDAAVEYYLSPAHAGELYVVLSPSIIAKAQTKAPNGLDWAQLEADFAAL